MNGSSWKINNLSLSKKITISIVQHPPVFMNLKKSVDLAIEYVKEVTNKGAEIVVFPETWLPGYPAWLDFSPNAGLWDHPPAKTVFRLLFENALEIDSSLFNKLADTSRKYNCLVVMGCHEKVGRTLYNSIFYFKSDGSFDLHRKLMPTYTERLVWGNGDGSTLPVFEHKNIKVGGLICWEHWMPLARAAMHQQNEDIHIAQWPMVKELHQLASRNYAFEGQCYVITAGCSLTKKQMMDGVKSVIESKEDEPALELIKNIPVDEHSLVLKGGSSVIQPNSEFLVEPVYDQNELIITDLDLSRLSEGNLFLDTAGHYSRPDVFKLTVDTSPKKNVEFED